MRILPAAALSLMLLTGCSTVSGWFKEDEKKATLEGKRIDILADRSMLTTSASMERIPVVLPEAAPVASWPQEGGTPTQHFDHIAALKDATLVSEGAAGDHTAWSSGIAPSPVASQNAVFAMDGRGIISAHPAGNIAKISWRNATLKSEEALLGGGLVYAEDTLYAVTSNGRIAAINASDGKTKWTHPLALPVRSSPVYDNGVLYLVAQDSQLVAINANNGTILWQHRGIEENADLLGTLLPAVASDSIITAYPSGELYAVSKADGAMLWSDSLLLPQRTRATGNFSGVDANPIVAGNITLAVSSNGLLAANAVSNGLRIWELPAASLNTPWLSGPFLFLLTNGNQLLCLSARDGRIKWLTDPIEVKAEEDQGRRLSGPYLLSGRLVLISETGQLLFFSPEDGRKLGDKPFAAHVVAPPVFVGDSMYVLSQESTLYQYR